MIIWIGWSLWFLKIWEKYQTAGHLVILKPWPAASHLAIKFTLLDLTKAETQTKKPDYKQLLDEVFVISRIPVIKVEVGVTETLIILDITKLNLIIVLSYIERNKKKTHVCASSLTANKTKWANSNLTWLPLEIMHRIHTRHDYPWPWHDYCIICSYDITGADFENSLYAFGQSEKK